jgi:C4-dicarboxylate transporter DctQ subunit
MKKPRMMLEEHIIALLLLVMLAILSLNVIMRKLPVDVQFAFAEEIVVYLFVCCSMLGASAACARGANMGLTAIVDLCPRPVQAVCAIVSMLASILLFGFLFFQGAITVRMVFQYDQKTPILQIPQWIFTSFYCIGSGLYIFRVIQGTRKNLKGVPGT